MGGRFLHYLARQSHRCPYCLGILPSRETLELQRSTWTSTSLEILGTTTRQSSTQGLPYNLTLECSEDVEKVDVGKNHTIQRNPIRLTFGVEGREIAVLNGLMGREISVSGYQPEESLDYEDLLRENQELRDRLEEFSFQVAELQEFRKEIGQGPKSLSQG
jgi:hypothetical protein